MAKRSDQLAQRTGRGDRQKGRPHFVAQKIVSDVGQSMSRGSMYERVAIFDPGTGPKYRSQVFGHTSTSSRERQSHYVFSRSHPVKPTCVYFVCIVLDLQPAEEINKWLKIGLEPTGIFSAPLILIAALFPIAVLVSRNRGTRQRTASGAPSK